MFSIKKKLVPKYTRLYHLIVSLDCIIFLVAMVNMTEIDASAYRMPCIIAPWSAAAAKLRALRSLPRYKAEKELLIRDKTHIDLFTATSRT